MLKEQCLWREWYPWYPVIPIDDHVFWLEVVWRRRNPQMGRWEYRSFRSDFDKQIEASRQEI